MEQTAFKFNSYDPLDNAIDRGDSLAQTIGVHEAFVEGASRTSEDERMEAIDAWTKTGKFDYPGFYIAVRDNNFTPENIPTECVRQILRANDLGALRIRGSSVDIGFAPEDCVRSAFNARYEACQKLIEDYGPLGNLL